MRRFAQVFIILASFLVSTVQPAAAGRYCLQGRQWGYPGNCQFSTRHQCMATASGTDSTCGINPRYAHARQRLQPSAQFSGGNFGSPPIAIQWLHLKSLQ